MLAPTDEPARIRSGLRQMAVKLVSPGHPAQVPVDTYVSTVLDLGRYGGRGAAYASPTSE